MFIEILKAILFGIVEGVTEWLPISSTGHLILLNEFGTLKVSEDFQSMFDVVIQLGAILAVIVLFFHKLNPFSAQKDRRQKKRTWDLWFKVVAAIIPSGLVGILLDDWMDNTLRSTMIGGQNGFSLISLIVAVALIVYGIAFIVIEKRNKHLKPKVESIGEITYKTAFLIGCFQALSLIPGTSRSGSTILGSILIGVSRVTAAQFSFYMAVPVMFGASFIKLLKFGLDFTSTELIILLVGMVTAFLVSVIAIKFLMNYIKKRDFTAFGYYRIVLGVIVLLYFVLK